MENTKICKICNIAQHTDNFKNGLKGLTLKTCRTCKNQKNRDERLLNLASVREKDREVYQKNKNKRIVSARAYRKKYPERTRATNWKSKYGISPENYQSMLESQNNKCAICQRHQNDYGRIFSVDHNHSTGKIRALLCDPCNYGLGFYEKHKDKYVEYLANFD